ncbi:MAG: ATP-binding cassette domain-containing protein, partial [Bacteroidia bacterium]
SGVFTWGSDINRKKIGSLLESPNFYSHLTAERNLKIAADIKQVPYSDIDRVLQFVSLLDRKKSKFKTFSLGMKQRLAIASALLGNPVVLILDEPTNGLDPQGIFEIRELIHTISSQGITIIIASHMLDEVQKVCTDVAIIKNGNLLVNGKVDELLGDDNIIVLQADDSEKLKSILEQRSDVTNIKPDLNKLVASFSSEVSADTLNKELFEEGIVLSHLERRQKNLEMQFLELTK